MSSQIVQSGGVSQPVLYNLAADTVCLIVDERRQQVTSWHLEVYAGLDEGRAWLGTIDTSPAKSMTDLDASSRVVAVACLPGARSWMIEVTGNGPAEEVATVRLSGAQGFAGRVGVFRTEGRSRTVAGAGLAAARCDGDLPTVFSSAMGTNESAELLWLMVVDKASAPVDGDVPYAGLVVRLAPGATFELTGGAGGVFLPHGLAWAVSTTPAAVTLPVDGSQARVTTFATW